ncbi:MAG: hypothetical protein NW201_09865, partial [Gemmatimonadales bacterium]|nr:hypothetical protein [Gemmatimonadales bacterium]
ARRPARAMPGAREAPLAAALARLDAIERADLAGHGAVDRHYGAVGDVVRDFLHDTARVARRRTATTTLVRELPTDAAPAEPTARVLGAADLVKYARVAPDARTAGRFVAEVRDVLRGWDGTGETPGGDDAVR